MLKKGSSMKFSEVSLLQENARQFFAEVYISFLQKRIDGLQNGALGESRFVSQWLAIIAKENAIAVLAKLQKYDEKLQNYQGIAPETEIDAQDELMTISRKTIEHLLRAKEVITIQANNSNKSVQYIPVPPHKVQADLVNAVQQKCLALLSQYPYLTVEAEQKKSWFTNILRLGSALVGIRVIAFGLFKVSPFALPLAADHEVQANRDLREMCALLESINAMTLPPCGKTREMLKCANAKDNPGESSLHFKYFPLDIEAPLARVKKYVAEVPADKSLDANVVLDRVKTTYPKPN